MSFVARIERAFMRICNPTSKRDASPQDPSECGRTDQDAGDQVSHTCKSPGPGTPMLCGQCSNFDFRKMLEEEVPEQSMGLLSDHLDEQCPFCALISLAVQQHWGQDWSSARLADDSRQTPTLFIQSRSLISSTEQGHMEHPEPRLLLALDVTPPNYDENRAVIREIDRVKDRHIIAEIEPMPGSYSDNDVKNDQLLSRREVPPQLDYELVKRWIHECKQHEHTKKSYAQLKQNAIDTGFFSSRHGFRLIDVEEECLVLRTKPCAFAALSYVWGRLPTVLYPIDDVDKLPILLTTMDNLEILSQPRGLSASRIDEMKGVRLPTTIQDAMELSRKIGMRYLWIDTLCIVQDDKKDKSFLINAMDDIYDMATVTFIAASGNNADAGLPGVGPRKGRPLDPISFVDDGITQNFSLSPPSLGEEVRMSKWNTRGWTFQEQALSQRCLYFTPDEVYFNCIDLQWREAYDLERLRDRPKLHIRTGPPWWNRKLRKDLDPTPYHYLGDLTGTLTIKDYQAAVQDYSRKTLSFPEDVLHAFEGVFNRFSKCDSSKELSLEQSQGIPAAYLHQALLWFPSDEAVPRKTTSKSEEKFSSWTWATWDGAIEFVFADSMWLSRNITQAPMKKIPIHVLIPFWYYGDSDKRFYTQDIWEAACESPDKMEPSLAKPYAAAKSYAKDHLGLNMGTLLSQSKFNKAPCLKVGQLGFMAAYLGAGDVSLSAKQGSHKISKMGIGKHCGEFRFDDESGEVEEYVAVVTADTITPKPDRQSIFLGLSTQNGKSRRVGVGWVYYSQTGEVKMPNWKFKFFQLE